MFDRFGAQGQFSWRREALSADNSPPFSDHPAG
jgi:hypothetical protein